MHRTTILLPPELYQFARKEARSLGISFGELIRRRLAASTPQPAAEKAFFARHPWTGQAPSDLSTSHDLKLYGS